MKCTYCNKELPQDAVFCPSCGRKVAGTAPRTRRGNGLGSVVKRPGGGWQVTVTLGWYLVDGKPKRRTASKTFAKKSDAMAAAITMKQDSRPDAKETLEQLHVLYLAGKDYAALSKSQQDKLTYAWRRWEPLRFRSIASLTVDELQRTVDSAVTTYYPARDMKVLISHLYALAIRREIVTLNKSELIELPDAPKAKREVWTADEVAAIWADYEAGSWFAGYILIMCYCGLRYGELATQQLSRIDLDNHVMVGGIKTEAGIDRQIPIADRILPVIRIFYDAHTERLLELGENEFYKQYWDMIDRLQLRRLPPQTCRHYYFSQLTAAGVQAGIITETGGHASYLTTMKNYVRISLEDKLDAVNKIK